MIASILVLAAVIMAVSVTPSCDKSGSVRVTTGAASEELDDLSTLRDQMRIPFQEAVDR